MDQLSGVVGDEGDMAWVWYDGRCMMDGVLEKRASSLYTADGNHQRGPRLGYNGPLPPPLILLSFCFVS